MNISTGFHFQNQKSGIFQDFRLPRQRSTYTTVQCTEHVYIFSKKITICSENGTGTKHCRTQGNVT